MHSLELLIFKYMIVLFKTCQLMSLTDYCLYYISRQVSVAGFRSQVIVLPILKQPTPLTNANLKPQ